MVENSNTPDEHCTTTGIRIVAVEQWPASTLDRQAMKAIPGKIIRVEKIPRCDFCRRPGPYDFATKHGPWAHGCEQHWKEYRANQKLGVGMGQFWFVEDES
jgi:hypothetical protein